MKREVVSCEWDMIQDEIPLDDLKIMGVRGAIRKGMTKEEALEKYGLTADNYDQNYDRVMKA